MTIDGNKKCLLMAMVFTCSCATAPVYQRGPLVELVLRPRKGYQDRLTNKRCAERKKHSGECARFDVQEFDFNDAKVRSTLRELKFVCNVRGERYAPCPTARGLCQLRKEDSGWGPFRKTEVKLNKYLSLHDDYDFLIAADTYCAAFNSAVGGEMFQ